MTGSKDINYLLGCVIRALYFKKCLVTFEAETSSEGGEETKFLLETAHDDVANGKVSH